MKFIELHAPIELIELLSSIITVYAHAAYPPGGSECAQASRETLLIARQRLLQEYDHLLQKTTMSRRLRAQFKAAINFSVENDDLDKVQSQHLLKLIVE